MAVEVTMPQMGADMTEGTLVRWLKAVGDDVSRGEIIAEVETDKATVELEAFESGTLRQIVVDEGETVPVGENHRPARRGRRGAPRRGAETRRRDARPPHARGGGGTGWRKGAGCGNRQRAGLDASRRP